VAASWGSGLAPAFAEPPSLARIRQAIAEGQWALATNDLNVLLGQPLPAEIEADARLLRARMALERGEPARALADLDVVERLGPSLSVLAEAQYARGEALYRMGRYVAAAEAFERFSASAPSNPNVEMATLLRADAVARSGGAEAAVSLYDRIIQSTAKPLVHQRAVFGRAWCLRTLGREEEALTGFKVASGGADAAVAKSASFEAGVSLFRVRRFEEALQWIPQTPEGLDPVRQAIARGQCLFALGRRDEALPHLERAAAFATGPERDAVLYKIGWSQLEIGNPEAALGSFEELARNPEGRAAAHSAGLYGSAVTLLRLGRTSDALPLLETLRSADNDPWGPDALYALALAHHNLGDYAASSAMLDELQTRYPSSPLVGRRELVDAPNLLLTERYEEAVAAFEQRVSANRSDEDLFRLGVAFYKAGDHAKAEGAFRDIVENHPESAVVLDARFWLAEAIYRQGRVSEARREYEALHAAAPDGAKASDAAYGLAWCDFSEGKYAEAAERFGSLTTAFRGTGREEDVLYRRATCYVRLGRFEEALADDERLLREHPQGRLAEHAAVQRVAALDSLGRKDEAARALAEMPMRFPGSPVVTKALYAAANGQYAAGDYAAAAEGLSAIAASATTPDSLKAEARLRLADCYFAMRDFNRAATLFEALSDPSMPQRVREKAFEGRVRSLENAGRTTEARKEAELADQALPTDETSGAAAYEIGIRRLDEGHWEEGIASLRQVIERQKPTEHVLDAYVRSAEAAEKLGDKALAAELHRGAAERSAPKEAMSHRFEAGQLLYEVGKYSEAREEFAKILLLDPDASTRDYAVYNLGLTQKETGEEAKALESFEKVATRAAADKTLRADALLEAGLLARKLEKGEAACRYFCEAATEAAGSTAAEAQYWCAECDFDGEKYEVAIEGFRRVVENHPTETEWVASARYRMAESFEKLDRWKEAQEEYERIVAGNTDETWTADARRRLDWIKENTWVFEEKKPGDR